VRDEAGEQGIAEAVAGAVGGLLGIDAAADDHVQVFLDELGDQRRGARGVVGDVAVAHQVDVGIDVGEHAAHDVALALQGLAAHDGAGGGGHLGRTVLRVVVVDVDPRLRKFAPEAFDDGADGGLLVIARQDHCDVEAGISGTGRFDRQYVVFQCGRHAASSLRILLCDG
jgi:hypothetical protein